MKNIHFLTRVSENIIPYTLYFRALVSLCFQLNENVPILNCIFYTYTNNLTAHLSGNSLYAVNKHFTLSLYYSKVFPNIQKRKNCFPYGLIAILPSYNFFSIFFTDVLTFQIYAMAKFEPMLFLKYLFSEYFQHLADDYPYYYYDCLPSQNIHHFPAQFRFLPNQNH